MLWILYRAPIKGLAQGKYTFTHYLLSVMVGFWPVKHLIIELWSHFMIKFKGTIRHFGIYSKLSY